MSLNIADNLKYMRNKNGYTLENLAEIISVSRQTIAKWEAEESYPDLLNCVKLASLYKISLDELVNGPMREVDEGKISSRDGKICGVLKVNDEGYIRIPEQVMEMFEIHIGEKVLLLADQQKGIAVIKCSKFD